MILCGIFRLVPISFSSTFCVISRKFELHFGQCTKCNVYLVYSNHDSAIAIVLKIIDVLVVDMRIRVECGHLFLSVRTGQVTKGQV